MPGIIGFLHTQKLNSFSHKSFSSVDGTDVFCSDDNAQLMVKSVSEDVGVHVYKEGVLTIVVFGEIYSISGNTESITKIMQSILSAYRERKLLNLAADLNGYFTGIIIDQERGKAVLISDRYGLKPIYIWSEGNKILGFSTEAKALVLHDNFSAVLDKDALTTFVDMGHLLGLQTFFLNIKRHAPATITEVDINNGTFIDSLYWTWSNIRNNSVDSESEAIDKAYQLFEQAMHRQLNLLKQKKLSITLSGGLDSRVLLASAKKHFKGDISSYTFGSLGCEDGKIAKAVSELAGISNEFIEVNEKNWFDDRCDGVWYTDGMKNILHMHALSSVKEITKHSNYLLNGFLGDVAFGGSYLLNNLEGENDLSKKAKVKYKEHAGYALFNSSYFCESVPDSLFIYNRGVRFIGAGSDLLGNQLQNVKPFFDNDLIDYLYSLPEDYRRGGKLYHAMLLKFYPEFFSTIPWQQTGKPISPFGEKIQSKESLKNKIFRYVKGSPFDGFFRKIYRKVKKNNNYVSYDAWLRQPDFKDYVFNKLSSETSVVSQLFTPKVIKESLNKFYRGDAAIKPEQIGSLLTIEIYCEKLKEHGKNFVIRD